MGILEILLAWGPVAGQIDAVLDWLKDDGFDLPRFLVSTGQSVVVAWSVAQSKFVQRFVANTETKKDDVFLDYFTDFCAFALKFLMAFGLHFGMSAKKLEQVEQLKKDLTKALS